MNWRKSICCTLALMLALLAPAASLAVIPDDCGRKNCTCFLQKDDEGVAVRGVTGLLAELGYLEKFSATYTDDVVYAVTCFQEDYLLPVTGMMDDDTLTYLIYGMLSDEMTIKYPEYDEGVVYVPTDGGTKYHWDPKCSKMDHPRKMSARNAEGLGIEPCKRCTKGY